MGCTSSVVVSSCKKRDVEPKQQALSENNCSPVRSSHDHGLLVSESNHNNNVDDDNDDENDINNNNDKDSLIIPDNENEKENIKENGSEYQIKPYIPQVYIDHVIGLDEEKRTIKEIIDTFVFNFDDFTNVGMLPTKGVLLHGSSGCGKALIAEAFACKYAFNFVSVNTVDLHEQYACELIKRVKETVPCVLLLKRLDSVVNAENVKSIKKSINKIVEQILDTNERVFIFGTTIKEKNVDSALLRNGRLEKKIHVPKPGKEARYTKWCALLGQPNRLFYKCDVDFHEMADMTRGLTHADLEYICEITFKNCGVTMDISSQRQSAVITREHLVQSIQEFHSLERGNTIIENPD